MPTALITGVTGQDGAHQPRPLPGLGHRVIGPAKARTRRGRMLETPAADMVEADLALHRARMAR